MRKKYREERDKRIRDDGNDQYVEMAGDYAHYLEDPYVAPIEREPLTDEVDVVIIGGGFGGLLAGARLRQAGVDDIRIIEKGGDFGGTWYWNRYPGAMCDVESYIYLPLLEEVGYVPKEKYTHAPEILEHSRAIGEHVRPLSQRVLPDRGHRARAGTTTTTGGSCTPTAATRCAPGSCAWRAGRCTGRSCRASRASRSSRATRSTPAAGTTTTRAATATGTSPVSTGKRVGIIGTGATAVQCVPHLGEAAEQLYVFQRTPSSIDVRGEPADRS